MLSEQKKSKLKWHCRRGMLELDLIFGRFLERRLNSMTEADYDGFERFLSHSDPDLYAWLMGYDVPSDLESKQFVTLIHTINNI
ncbi:MAG: succinate dehydrogenase assembly factor 2 [Legionellaceae bacterium]|nr:succinate dehydrogenase assembly factor 2 [Legionellaceae bacterium]